MTKGQHVAEDYASTFLSLKAHPVSFAREKLDQLKVIPNDRLKEGRDGQKVKVAGLVLVRQRPATSSGVCFITLEDETGFANYNLVVFENIFDKFRKEIMQSNLLMAEGLLQKEGDVVHVIVKRFDNLSCWLRQAMSQEDHLPLLAPQEKNDDHLRSVIPEARNFR